MSDGREAVPSILAPRVPRRLMLACAATLAIAAVWAFRPLSPPAEKAPVSDAPALPPVGSTRVALDLDAFRAPIWVQSPPPKQEAPGSPPPPLRVQLLAIFRDGEVYRAALYDPDADRLFVVSTGDSVAGRLVERVLADSVALRDGPGGEVRTLSRATGGAP